MTITYRTIGTEGFEPFLRAAELAFSAAPSLEDVERERTLHEPDRRRRTARRMSDRPARTPTSRAP